MVHNLLVPRPEVKRTKDHEKLRNLHQRPQPLQLQLQLQLKQLLRPLQSHSAMVASVVNGRFIQTLFYPAPASCTGNFKAISQLPTAALPEDCGHAEGSEGIGTMHVRVESTLTKRDGLQRF